MTKPRICPTCHHILDPQADYCEQCDQEFCPECFEPISANATKCGSCGTAFALYCPQCDADLTGVEGDFCPQCQHQLGTAVTPPPTNAPEGDSGVRLIHNRALLARTTVAHALSGGGAVEDEEGAVVDCPTCGEPAYLDEGFCEHCSTTFCPHCIKAIEEEDETCPHCGTLLYFECPNCSFELTTGTQICPNCNVLFLPYCLECNTAVQPLDEECPACGAELPLAVREVARVVHTLVSGRQLVYVFACSTCGNQFDSLRGNCPNCGTRVCSQCQLVLHKGEDICPQCRPDITTAPCPQCHNILPKGLDECPHCGQLLCPACGTAVTAEATQCAACGVEFELTCPNCEAVISATDETCPACHYEFHLG